MNTRFNKNIPWAEIIEALLERSNHAINNSGKTRIDNEKLKKHNSKIVRILYRHGIDRLYHFTDRSNISSIKESGGLLSYRKLNQMGKKVAYASTKLSWSLDSQRELDRYVSLSFVRNLPMYWRSRYEKGDRFVWLEIDLDIVTKDGTLFSNINATDRDAIIGDFRSVYPYLDLDFLAQDTILSKLSPKEKKKMQAEVLIPDFIPLDKILNIGIFMQRSA